MTICCELVMTDWSQQGLFCGPMTLPEITMGSVLGGSLNNCVSKDEPLNVEAVEFAELHAAQAAELTPNANLMKFLLCSA